MSSHSPSQKRKFGDLDCVEIQLERGENATCDLLVVLCHGFGASGTDLVPCAGQLLSLLPHEDRTRVKFLFPAAPILLDQDGGYESRAWWPIDMLKLQIALQSGKFRELRNEDPAELPGSRHKLEACIDQCLQENSLSWESCIIGGFSQGAMICTETTLGRHQRPAGLIVWSGSLIREPQWTDFIQRPLQIPIVQSHGRQDMVLPYLGAELLRDLFTAAKADVNFIPFNGPHTISESAIAAAALLIQEVLDN